MTTKPATGLILAGGRGERLLSIAPLYSKTLLKINGLAVVVHAARALESFVNEIVVVTNPTNSSKIIEAVSEGIQTAPKKIITAIQTKPLGVAHAVGVGLEKIPEDRPVVVVCGDNILESQNVKTVLDCVRSYEDGLSAVKLAWTYKEFDAEIARRFAVWSPGGPGSGMLIEKPKNPPGGICWCGPIAFRSSHDVRKRIGTLSPSGRGEYEVTDLLNTYLLKGESRRFPLKGKWFDIGNPQAYEEAQGFMPTVD